MASGQQPTRRVVVVSLFARVKKPIRRWQGEPGPVGLGRPETTRPTIIYIYTRRPARVRETFYVRYFEGLSFPDPIEPVAKSVN